MRIRFLTLIFLCVSIISAYAKGKDSLEVSTQEVTLVKIKPAVYSKKNLLAPFGISSTKATQYKRWTALKYSGYIRSYNQFRTMPVNYGGPRDLINLNGY